MEHIEKMCSKLTLFCFLVNVLAEFENGSDALIENIFCDDLDPIESAKWRDKYEQCNVPLKYCKGKSENDMFSRIVGGTPAKWPFIVLLKLFKKTGMSLCGGTIISDNWILTAAHCFMKVKKV